MLSVADSSSMINADFLVDGNARSAAEFDLDQDEGNAFVVLKSGRQVTAHGLTLGLGVLVSVLWSTIIKNSRYQKAYIKNPFIKILAIVLTNTYFAFCILFFDANSPEKLALLKSIIFRFI